MDEDSFNITDTAFNEILKQSHLDRMAGNIEPAETSYQALASMGPPKISAESLLWLADLLMIEGKINDVLKINKYSTYISTNVEQNEYQGNRHRLLGLTYFYIFEFNEAVKFFDLSKKYFQQIHKNKPSAIAETNQIEVLAQINPREALRESPKAIRMHKTTSMPEEIGKILTAKAWAQMYLKDYDQAIESTKAAEKHLIEAKYIIGQARNLLVRGLAMNYLDNTNSQALLLEASRVLSEHNVYPTLIMLADRFTQNNNIHNQQLSQLSKNAESKLDLPSQINIYKNISKIMKMLES